MESPLERARPGEEAALLRLLERDPIANVFLIAPLQLGLGQRVEAWVQHAPHAPHAPHAAAGPAAARATSVLLLRWAHNWFSDAGPHTPPLDASAAARLIDDSPPEHARALIGHPTWVQPVLDHLRRYK